MTSMFKRLKLSHIITGICAGFIIISTVAVLASYLSYRETGNIQNVQNNYQTGPARKSVVLNNLQASLGFGGMIHQFKNYVIRQDEKRVAKIQDRIGNAESEIQQYLQLQHTPAEKVALDTIQQIISSYAVSLDTAMQMVSEGKSTGEIDNVIKIDDSPALNALKELNNIIKTTRDSNTSTLALSIQSLREQSAISAIIGLTVAALSSLFVIFAFRALLLQLGTEPDNLRTVAVAIADGNLDVDMSNGKKPASGVFGAMISMRDNLRSSIELDHRISAENGRIKQALENSSGSLMIADATGKIIYMNNAIKTMMSKMEPDMRMHKPDFRSEDLIGQSLDVFHKDTDGINEMLSNISETFVSDLAIGQRRVRIIVNPVYGENNERLGNVAEWEDKTQELQTEEEIQHIVNSANAGDLSQRVDLTGKDGFFQTLSAGVNELVDVSERVITDTVMSINAMSNGDLTRGIDGHYEGQYGQLKDDVNTTIYKLTSVVSEITTSAHSVLQGSEELAKGNNDLSSRTERQAANLEETASSMEEMTSIVRQNAESARDASDLASSARNKAVEGGEVVNNAVQAMSEITESSNKIGAIIGVIDEIAFQTNLLALNAAVEAARAGEQGRGFAVVASEVRNLAGRSATAANEIKKLIEDSVSKVEEGSRLVDASGKTLEQIVESVKSVSDIVDQIAVASQDQRDGIDLVNRAIAQMDESTQRNAALVQVASKSSLSIGSEARSLNQQVGFFKIDKPESGFGNDTYRANQKAA